MASWQDYANEAIRELYPKSRREVDYVWARAAPGDTQSMLVDNYGMDLGVIENMATYRMLLDPYNDYDPNPAAPPDPPDLEPAPTFTSEKVWPWLITLAGSTEASAQGLNIGTLFTVTEAGEVTGIRFYRTSASSSTAFTVALYGAGGTALATKAHTASGTGWQEATFDTPVAVSPGTTYTAAVHQTPNGGNLYYGARQYYYDSGAYAMSQTGRVRATGSAYIYGAAAKPTTTNTFGYFIDPLVTFADAAPAATPPGNLDEGADGYPMLSGYPDRTSAGVDDDEPLTIYVGAYRTRAAAETIAGLEVWGSMIIDHNSCIIEDCRVYNGDAHTVYFQGGTSGTVRRCKIRNTAKADGCNGIYGAGTFTYNDIGNCNNGVNVAGPSTISDNFMHSFVGVGVDPHYDGVEMNSGSTVTIEHNTILLNQTQTSPIQLNNSLGNLANVTVNNNYVAGGGYTIALRQFASNTMSGIVITNNKLRTGSFGYKDVQTGANPAPTWTGNVDAVTGVAVS